MKKLCNPILFGIIFGALICLLLTILATFRKSDAAYLIFAPLFSVLFLAFVTSMLNQSINRNSRYFSLVLFLQFVVEFIGGYLFWIPVIAAILLNGGE
ncbi:MAG: hypothetical protein EON54_04760 [Alcaligenaceae bacterium]|nr:MAG: hypothetical protein EON54_04760 [Alcaligenaceae bacterium]